MCEVFTNLATMEAANETARRAVNGIIAQSGEQAPLCSLWEFKECPPGCFLMGVAG